MQQEERLEPDSDCILHANLICATCDFLSEMAATHQTVVQSLFCLQQQQKKKTNMLYAYLQGRLR